MTPAARLVLAPTTRREPATRALGHSLRSFRKLSQTFKKREQLIAAALIALALAVLSLPLEPKPASTMETNAASHVTAGR